jgi:outer membrane protein assembly factor BamB
LKLSAFMTLSKLIRWVTLSSLLLAGLTACSVVGDIKQAASDTIFGEDQADPPAELEEIKASYTATIDWSLDVGDTLTYDYTPALESGNVYSANAAGEIVKVDNSNGRQVWRIKVGEPISGGVDAEAGMVIVGSSKGNVYAYDVDGKPLWKTKLSSEILSVPRYFDGTVIVRTNDNHIYGLNASDGARKWVYERIVPALSLRSSAGIVVDGGAVYAGFAGGKMVAIRADNGRLLWESSISQPKGVTEIERISDITSLPVVVVSRQSRRG